MTAPDAGFRRELGLFDSVVVVAGGIIGVGIFANPSNVARVVGDPVLILLVWALGGAVALIGGFIWRSWRRGIRTSAGSTSTCSAPILRSSDSCTASRCCSSSTVDRW